MVARLLPARDNILRLLLAISGGRGEEAAEVTIRMGSPNRVLTRLSLRSGLPSWSRHADASLNRLNSGQVVLK